MSLSVYLEGEDGEELFSANITHNLGPMADAAGIYKAVWRPEENGFAYAGQVAPVLKAGLLKMALAPSEFKQYDSPNGWGLYKHFLPWLAEYLEACTKHPDAKVSACR
jgi:hypothetical protein